MKQPNNKGRPRKGVAEAETVKGSALTKENTAQSNAGRTQSRITLSSGLGRVRQAAQGGKEKPFTVLLHHLTIDLLQESYYALQRVALPELTASGGRSTKPGWSSGLSNCTAACIGARIARFRGEDDQYSG